MQHSTTQIYLSNMQQITPHQHNPTIQKHSSSTPLNNHQHEKPCKRLIKMEQNPQIIENKLKNSFSNIKKDIYDLKSEINTIKSDLDQLKTILTKENFLSSTGNKGVINNHQQSTIINSSQQPTNQPILTPDNEEAIISTTLNNLKQQLEKTFKTLTDREFSIFMAIYELEQQLSKVTYADIASHLSLTEMTVRSYVSSLINKNVPIEKTRRFNNKLSLSIKKELKDLNLASKLISLRMNNPPQQTLFSNY